MASFRAATLTAKGIALIAKLLANNETTRFTRAATGNGDYTDDEPLLNRTNLKSERQSFGFSSVSIINTTTVQIKFKVTNKTKAGATLSNGYYVKEVGIFADDPDEGEILYAIAVANQNQWDYLPAYNDTSESTIDMSFYTEVSNANNIEIKVDNNGYVTVEDVENIVNIKINEHDASRQAHIYIQSLINDLSKNVTVIISEQFEEIYNYLESLEIEKLKGNLEEHIETIVNSSSGVHGIRYIENKLQVWVKDEWVDISLGNNNGTTGGGTGGTGGGTGGTGGGTATPTNTAPGNVKNLSITPGVRNLNLVWTDPEDTNTSTWAGTKVLMSTTGFPQNEHDGTLIANVTTKNAYKNNSLVIDNLEYKKTYYFAVFPYSNKNLYNTNSSNKVSGIPNPYGAGAIWSLNIHCIEPRQIRMLWEDSRDTAYEKWKATHITIKEGGIPQNINDGQKVLTNTIHNKYFEIETGEYFYINDLKGNTQYGIYIVTESVDGIFSEGFTKLVTTKGLSSGDCKWIETTAGIECASIRWEDPKNIAGQQEWVVTYPVYKMNEIPTNYRDGICISSIFVRDAYKDNPLIIRDLVPGAKYYFKLFTSNNDDSFNNPTEYRTIIPLAAEKYKTYSVDINFNNPNPSTCCTYTGNIDIPSGSDMWWKWFGVYPVLFKNGQEVKRLKYNNFLTDVDGYTISPGPTAIGGGDIMIAFPRRGIKIEKLSGYQVRVSITDDPNKAGFSYLAHQKNGANKDVFYLGAYLNSIVSGYLTSIPNASITTRYQLDNLKILAQQRNYEIATYAQLLYLQVLFVIMFKSLQSSIAGSGSSSSTTGSTVTHPMFNGAVSFGQQQTKVFGLESLWGNVNQIWADFKTDGNRYITINGVSTTTRISDVMGYASNIIGNNYGGFFATDVNGSSTTYLCAYQSTMANTNYLLQETDGLYSMVCHNNIYGVPNMGSRLLYM